MKLSLAFGIYNKERWIKSLLESWVVNLSGQNNYEVIIVFDDLKDRSKEIADEFLTRYKVGYLPLFADGKYEVFCNNLAFQTASGDYIIFIQDDNWIHDKNWDLTLSQTISRIPNIGIVGFLSGLKVLPSLHYRCVEVDRPHKGELFTARGIQSYQLAVWQVDAVNRPFAISTQLLREKSGLDPSFMPTYGDDFDLSLKLLKDGRTNIYIPFDLVNTAGYKDTMDRTLFREAKRQARAMWHTRYGSWLQGRDNATIRKLLPLEETEEGLCIR